MGGAWTERILVAASRRESRAHCEDLESAYVQGCERLEQAVLVRERDQGAGWGGGCENAEEWS